jgi:hypothetical protein
MLVCLPSQQLHTAAVPHKPLLLVQGSSSTAHTPPVMLAMELILREMSVDLLQ